MEEMLNALRRQGVLIDIVAVADEIAADCPKWSDFILRLKKRAQENIYYANKIIEDNKKKDVDTSK